MIGTVGQQLLLSCFKEESCPRTYFISALVAGLIPFIISYILLSLLDNKTVSGSRLGVISVIFIGIVLILYSILIRFEGFLISIGVLFPITGGYYYLGKNQNSHL